MTQDIIALTNNVFPQLLQIIGTTGIIGAPHITIFPHLKALSS